MVSYSHNFRHLLLVLKTMLSLHLVLILMLRSYQLFVSFLRCLCGNCDIENLQNISECYCCQELEGCVESLSSELVMQDLADGQKLFFLCITAHPGFNAVCLQKWSLRLAADKYKTKGRQKYRQTGSEEK